MARLKRTSATITIAETRVALFEALDPALDFGEGLAVVGLKADVVKANEELAKYNTELSKLDVLANKLKTTERALAKKTKRMIGGIVLRYGEDSIQYQQTGGSYYKTPAKKTKPDAPTGGK